MKQWNDKQLVYWMSASFFSELPPISRIFLLYNAYMITLTRGIHLGMIKVDLASKTPFGYSNEYSGDSTQLLYLRSSMYAPGMGRFLTRDTWHGDTNTPMSFNHWMYTEGNPINYTDAASTSSLSHPHL